MNLTILRLIPHSKPSGCTTQGSLGSAHRIHLFLVGLKQETEEGRGPQSVSPCL